MEKVSPQELKDILKAVLPDPKSPPIFILGSPGVGKSSIVNQVGKELELEVRTQIATTMDPTDIKGFPKIGDKNVQWVPPDFFPVNEETKGILFWDELTTAPPTIQAAVYRVILEGYVGNKKLPELWKRIAAGNKLSDKAVVFQMPTPLRNRFMWVELVPNVNDFRKYGLENQFDFDVLSYIAFDSNKLYLFNPEKDDETFPTPRSWEFVSNIVKLNKENISEKLLRKMISGCVGQGTAVEFLTFRKLKEKLPDPRDIIDKGKNFHSKRPDISYLVGSTTLAYVLNNKTKKRIERLAQYYINYPHNEFKIHYIQDALFSGLKEIVSTEIFNKNMNKLSELVI